MKNTISIAIATRNQLKTAAIAKAFGELFPDTTITLDVFDVASGVPETPWDDETKQGATNRAQKLFEKNKDHDYYVGIESGLVTRYKDIYEEAWGCIFDKSGRPYYGYSSGLKVPDSVTSMIQKKAKTHAEAMDIMQKKFDLAPGDTWGNYTANALSRSNSIEEAVRNALIQIVSPAESLYKLS